MKSDTGQPTRTRFWFDPRFAIGLALVVASVAGVYALVSSADTTTDVFAARTALAVGDRIDASDLVPTPVRLGGADRLYVTPDRLPEDGLVVTRTIAAGELIPASAVGSTAGASVTSVVVEVRGRLAAAIAPGSVVDVWSARQADNAGFGPPVVLVGEASVVRIVEATGIMASDDGQAVEILVPKGKVAAVLESLANGDAIDVVAVNTALGDRP